MSAHDQIRAMLDQLMGTSRNGEEEKLQIKYDDPRVCKSFLLGCCPHEILASTRMDLGECPKLHNLALKADFESASKEKDYFYDLDALEQLAVFVADADRKTEQARKRLAETQEELSTEVSMKADRVHELAERIGESLAKAEALGAEGLVEESMKLMEEVEALRREKSEAEAEYRASIPAATYQQQKLRVCDVCCAYLGIHDNDRRLADHFGGKLHLGFIKIRETLIEFQGKAEERRRQRRDSLRAERLQEDRRREVHPPSTPDKPSSLSRRSRSNSRERRRSKRRSRSRDRSSSKRERKKSRSPHRSRSHHHKSERNEKRTTERRRSSSRDRSARHSAKRRSRSGSGGRDRDNKREERGGTSSSSSKRAGRTASMSEEEPGEI